MLFDSEHFPYKNTNKNTHYLFHIISIQQKLFLWLSDTLLLYIYHYININKYFINFLGCINFKKSDKAVSRVKT